MGKSVKATGHKHVADWGHRPPAGEHVPKASGGATFGQLVAEASRDLSALVQAELQLAKNELSFSAKAGGIGTGLFLVAGFMAAVVLILASFGLALVLDLWLPAWVSFFIVAGFYLLVAAVAVLVGIRLIKKVKAPTATIATAKEIPSAFKD
ncbi:MAG TPA: phage holin family protein [Aeromicrobium sp.]|nr:phage holin family protein [Aeromicrobium sp.]